MNINNKKFWESCRGLITVPNGTALLFLVLTLATAGQYGFFGDELYYFACSKHLAWGYVDHPPMVAVLTLVSTWIFGETMFSLRLMSGLAGAITVLLSAHIAKILGGGKFSQSLAALSICFASLFLALSSFFSMNPVDIMLCTLFIALFLKTIKAPTSLRWVVLGVLLGVGLLNKYTFLILGFSLLLSLIISRQWKVLRSPWLYISGGIGLLLFLPHIVWQIQQGWPTLEFMSNATGHKNLSVSPLVFLFQLIVGFNPFTFPIWFSGLLYLILSDRMKEFRFLGWAGVIFFSIYMFQNSKFYYVAPIFPFLLSAGAIAVERLTQKDRMRRLRWGLVSVLIITGTIMMPLTIPILPVKHFVTYLDMIGLRNTIKMEKGEGTLPLHFVHRFGWEELVDTVGHAYSSLPQDEREKCIILGSWYGIAGAIDHFGPRHGLPNAICPHNNYWIWGKDNFSIEVVLAVGYSRHSLEQYFDSVERIGHFSHPYVGSKTLYLCKKPKAAFNEIWPQVKHFI